MNARVGLAALAFFMVTSRGLTVGDAAVHLDVADGLVSRGDLALSFDVGPLAVSTEPVAGALLHTDAEGRVRSSLPLGMALVGAPLVAVGGLFTDRPLADVIAPLFDPETRELGAALGPLNRDPRALAFALLGPISGAISILCVWLLLDDVSRRARLAAVIALALSPLGVFAGTGWTQSVTAACLAFGAWRVRRGQAWEVGLALALATLVRPDHAPLAIPFALAVDRRPRDLAAVLGPVAAVGLLYAALAPTRYGGGYAWATVIEGLSGLLFSPLTGLFVYAPFALVGLLGAPRLGRLRWLLLVPGIQLATYAAWFDWSAHLAYGPRFLVPSLPILAVAFGLAFERHRAPALLAIAVGAALAIPGLLLAHARIPEVAAWAHPTFVDAWAALLRGGVIDCTSTYVPAQAVGTLVVISSFALLSRRRGPGPRSTTPP